MSGAPEATRIETLRLLNYRRFEDTLIDFDPELTVLVSPNGGGKTAILDALAAAWRPFVNALEVQPHGGRLSKDDVRRVMAVEQTMEPAQAARLLAAGSLLGEPLAWAREVSRAGVLKQHQLDGVWQSARQLQQHVIDYAASKRSRPPCLPLLCHYGTGRLWNTGKPKRGKKQEKADTSRWSGYTDCLSPASSFQFFEAWFRRFSYEAQSELTSGHASPHRPRERLAGVCSAVDRLLAPSGWHRLAWDFAEDALTATHPEHGRLPVRLLSDGIRNMIGLVGDIAHRAVRLNPHLGADAPVRTPGIVLIDEVDMHLHPGWQQTAVPSLREAFPAMQLIVTTHSHLVISTVLGRCIRILGADGSVSTPSVETQGYESPFALGVVFGVNTAPPIEIGRQLTRYRALLELGQGDTEEAEGLRKRLLAHFGATHPAMLEAEGHRRLQELKARIAARRGGA